MCNGIKRTLMIAPLDRPLVGKAEFSFVRREPSSTLDVDDSSSIGPEDGCTKDWLTVSNTSTAPPSDCESICSIQDTGPCSTTAATSASAVISKSTERHVRFGTIEIREHVVVLGATSVPKYGAPLMLSDEIQGHYCVPVDEYEKERPNPRSEEALFRSARNRCDLLLAMGYTLREIKAQEAACEMIRKQRQESSKHHKAFSWHSCADAWHKILHSHHHQHHPRLHPRKP